MRIVNFGAGGDGVFAEKTEIKVHSVFQYTSVIANNQINADNFAGVGLFSVFKRKGQNRFNNALFVHEWNGAAAKGQYSLGSGDSPPGQAAIRMSFIR